MNSFKVSKRFTDVSAEAFRSPLIVDEILIFKNIDGEMGYYICPRCNVSLEREFVSYCDRCGQALDWKYYKKATPVFPKTHIKILK